MLCVIVTFLPDVTSHGNNLIFTLTDFSSHIDPIEINATSQGLPYDYASVMQLYHYQFHKSGLDLKIVPLHTTSKKIRNLTTLDKLHINLLYCGGKPIHTPCSPNLYYHEAQETHTLHDNVFLNSYIVHEYIYRHMPMYNTQSIYSFQGSLQCQYFHTLVTVSSSLDNYLQIQRVLPKFHFKFQFHSSLTYKLLENHFTQC